MRDRDLEGGKRGDPSKFTPAGKIPEDLPISESNADAASA